MPTPAEKKALLFIAAVALLGGVTRVWRAHHTSATPPAALPSEPSAPHSARHPKKTKSNGRSSSKARTAPADDEDLGPPLDLDVASLAQIEALGLLKPGQARMIVENRETYGPFGSLAGLERIPYFPRYAIVRLAPRVTFSRLPRPTNTVIQGRPDPQPGRRTRRRTPG